MGINPSLEEEPLYAAPQAGASQQAAPKGYVLVKAYKQCGRWADDAPGMRGECTMKFTAGTPCEKCPDAAPQASPVDPAALTDFDREAIRRVQRFDTPAQGADERAALTDEQIDAIGIELATQSVFYSIKAAQEWLRRCVRAALSQPVVAAAEPSPVPGDPISALRQEGSADVALADARDAARYRWLRGQLPRGKHDELPELFIGVDLNKQANTWGLGGRAADAVIDNAMKEQAP